MEFTFYKYHGAGNDFVLFDDRQKQFPADKKVIAQICHRRFGIGADGLILIRKHPKSDFEMIYYNADGGLGSMCGNGGRCAVIFSNHLGLIQSTASLQAFDGMHTAQINSDGTVKLSMNPVTGFKTDAEGNYILNTGSPHFINFVSDVMNVDVVSEGRKIRYGNDYNREGINVNFVSVSSDKIKMRTYERGVEDETLSCGTGTVAVAMAVAIQRKEMNQRECLIEAPGGLLKVYFNRTGNDQFEDVWLEGPAVEVYSGTIEI